MCGICGFVGRPRPQLLSAMLQRLEHRGPDDCGTFVSDGASLGARRLAIIDVAEGHQPTLNEDRTVAAALNGEIYNHLELRELLRRRGHRFRSDVDTEVIPHLYEEFGTGFVALLRGMFAIAVWDESKRRLLLARDRAGEKPLLYSQTKHGLVFASELKAILLDPDVPLDLDPTALLAYLTMQYVPGPTTIVGAVLRLPAAHLLVAESGNVTLQRYWDIIPGTEAHARSRDGVVAELRDRLTDAVGAQMHADVPVGVLLSGGVDSAGIAALMTRLSDEPPRTFTVGFEHSALDEREPAAIVAHALGTKHTELVVEEPKLDDLERFVWHLDEPLADQAALPTFLIAQVASEHVKVVLTGEGSDELFGGYPRYRWFRRAELIERLSPTLAAPLRRTLLRVLENRRLDLLLTPREPLERHVAWTRLLDDHVLDDLLAPEWQGSGSQAAIACFQAALGDWTAPHTVEEMMALDFKTWLVDDVLTKADRMSMGASIEARAPYLDSRVIDFAASLPASVRLTGHGTKALLREALAHVVPSEALHRPKAAFRVPAGQWLGASLAPVVREMLLDPGAATASYFSRTGLERLLARRDRGGQDRQVWALAILELWMRLVLHAPRAASTREAA
jgi:asparagine synthase (glutamine-hydrolysing)